MAARIAQREARDERDHRGPHREGWTAAPEGQADAVVVLHGAGEKQKSLTLRGTATDEISDKPEKNQKKLEKITDKMFKSFPPGSGDKK